MFEGFHQAEFAGMTEDGLAVFREGAPQPPVADKDRPYSRFAPDDTKGRAAALLATLMSPTAW